MKHDDRPEIQYCPWCGDELTLKDAPLTTGYSDAYGECYAHGHIGIEVWNID